MCPTFGQLKKNSGQATVEYILLLVISVALILGPLKQFSKFFNAYVGALFDKGQYVACLLETGALGGQSSDPTSCSAVFTGAIQTALNNNSSSPSSNSSSSTSNSNQNGQSSSSSSSNKKTGQSSGSVADSGSGSSGAGTGDFGGGGGFGNRDGKVSAHTVGEPSSLKNGEEDSFVKIGERYDYKDLKPKTGFEISLDRLDRRVNSDGEDAKRAAKLAPKDVASTNTRNLRAKELILDPSRAPAAKESDVDVGGMGFSVIIKWFLIACLLIALFVFVGGQVLQISKGGEN